MDGHGSVRNWLTGIGIGVLVVAIAGSIFLLVPREGGPAPTVSPTSTAAQSPSPTGSSSISPSPSAPETSPPDQGTPLAPVTPFITSASVDGASVTVYGFVPGLAESGGTCRAFVVGGSADESAQAEAFAEAGNTSCPPLAVPLAATGEAIEVQLEYLSSTSTGVSDPVAVTP